MDPAAAMELVARPTHHLHTPKSVLSLSSSVSLNATVVKTGRTTLTLQPTKVTTKWTAASPSTSLGTVSMPKSTIDVTFTSVVVVPSTVTVVSTRTTGTSLPSPTATAWPRWWWPSPPYNGPYLDPPIDFPLGPDVPPEPFPIGPIDHELPSDVVPGPKVHTKPYPPGEIIHEPPSDVLPGPDIRTKPFPKKSIIDDQPHAVPSGVIVCIEPTVSGWRGPLDDTLQQSPPQTLEKRADDESVAPVADTGAAQSTPAPKGFWTNATNFIDEVAYDFLYWFGRLILTVGEVALLLGLFIVAIALTAAGVVKVLEFFGCMKRRTEETRDGGDQARSVQVEEGRGVGEVVEERKDGEVQW